MTPCTGGFLSGCVIVYFGFLEEKGPIFCSIGLQSPSVRSASERLVDTLFLSKCEKIERMAFSDHLLIHPMLQLPGDPLLTTSKPSISTLAILGATRGRFVFSINHIFKYQQIWLCQSLRSFWTPGKCTTTTSIFDALCQALQMNRFWIDRNENSEVSVFWPLPTKFIQIQLSVLYK